MLDITTINLELVLNKLKLFTFFPILSGFYLCIR